MLCAEDIIEQSKKDSSLPNIGGIKFYKSDGSKHQQDSLSSSLNEYYKLLKEERICRRSNLSIANWDVNKNVAVVETVKGSYFQKFGHQTKDGKFLNPEETLFLLDQGLLQLKYQDLPLSLQECYMMIIPLLPSFEYYQVYAYLCRLGFLLTRFVNSASSVSSGDTEEEIIDTKENDATAADDFEPMASGYMKSLWNDDEQPLIRPSDSISTAAVLSKLQIIKPLKLKDVVIPQEALASTRYTISFNVYVSLQQRKSDLAEPNFRVVICRFYDKPPTLLEMSQLTKLSNGVNLKIAVVNQGTVSFYGLFGVDLPTLINYG